MPTKNELIESARVSYGQLLAAINKAAHDRVEPKLEDLQPHIAQIDKCLSAADVDSSVLDPKGEKPAGFFDATIKDAKKKIATLLIEAKPSGNRNSKNDNVLGREF